MSVDVCEPSHWPCLGILWAELPTRALGYGVLISITPVDGMHVL